MHKSNRATTPDGAVVSQRFHITHPFHPELGQEFEVVNWHKIRNLDVIRYQDTSGCLRSISASFTSLMTPDPVVALGNGRSRFRIADL
ncbi:MAG: hypothetical protein HY820_20385, partial [Acidobacteria bacterium]|nr:hypothetical protein [Acidobacteriota bacterium]